MSDMSPAEIVHLEAVRERVAERRARRGSAPPAAGTTGSVPQERQEARRAIVATGRPAEPDRALSEDEIVMLTFLRKDPRAHTWALDELRQATGIGWVVGVLRDLADGRLIALDELAADVVVIGVRPIPRRIRGTGPFAAAHHPNPSDEEHLA